MSMRMATCRVGWCSRAGEPGQHADPQLEQAESAPPTGKPQTARINAISTQDRGLAGFVELLGNCVEGILADRVTQQARRNISADGQSSPGNRSAGILRLEEDGPLDALLVDVMEGASAIRDLTKDGRRNG